MASDLIATAEADAFWRDYYAALEASRVPSVEPVTDGADVYMTISKSGEGEGLGEGPYPGEGDVVGEPMMIRTLSAAADDTSAAAPRRALPFLVFLALLLWSQ